MSVALRRLALASVLVPLVARARNGLVVAAELRPGAAPESST